MKDLSTLPVFTVKHVKQLDDRLEEYGLRLYTERTRRAMDVSVTDLGNGRVIEGSIVMGVGFEIVRVGAGHGSLAAAAGAIGTWYEQLNCPTIESLPDKL